MFVVVPWSGRVASILYCEQQQGWMACPLDDRLGGLVLPDGYPGLTLTVIAGRGMSPFGTTKTSRAGH